MAGAEDFDFLLGSWDIHDRRFDAERGWEEFPGRSNVEPRLVGRFADGVGRFHQVIEDQDGTPLHVEFIWDEITGDCARWQQSFSHDGGTTWDLNWVMQLTRRA